MPSKRRHCCFLMGRFFASPNPLQPRTALALAVAQGEDFLDFSDFRTFRLKYLILCYAKNFKQRKADACLPYPKINALCR